MTTDLFNISKNAQERAKRLNNNECLACGYRLIPATPKLKHCFNKDCKEFTKLKEM